MRKILIAASTAVALLATASPAVAQTSPGSVSASDARETVQSSSQSSDSNSPVLDAWSSGSALPNSLNPVDLLNREFAASAMLVSGDIELSAQGSSQLTRSWIVWAMIVLAVGQAVELVMRGLRLAQ